MKAGEIEKLQTSSISRVLEGTVSGVQASAASGQPGTDAEIRIRGIGSMQRFQRSALCSGRCPVRW